MPNSINLLLAILLLLPTVVILIPVLLMVWVIDRSNPLFIQKRVGQHEKPFYVYKVRTMHVSTGDVPTHSVAKSSVTPLGKLLRKLKLDELPQIINVLNGTMNFVGPRPGLAVQTALSDARRARGIYEVRPGITGLAQVKGIDMSDPDLLARVDEVYVHSRSTLGDIRLMLQTVAGAAFKSKDSALEREVNHAADEAPDDAPKRPAKRTDKE